MFLRQLYAIAANSNEQGGGLDLKNILTKEAAAHKINASLSSVYNHVADVAFFWLEHKVSAEKMQNFVTTLGVKMQSELFVSDALDPEGHPFALYPPTDMKKGIKQAAVISTAL